MHVEIGSTSLMFQVPLSLSDDVIAGRIRYEVLVPGLRVAQSVTETVQKALVTSVGGILSQTIQFLQHATQYTPRIKVFAANGSQIIEEVGTAVTTKEGGDTNVS